MVRASRTWSNGASRILSSALWAARQELGADLDRLVLHPAAEPDDLAHPTPPVGEHVEVHHQVDRAGDRPVDAGVELDRGAVGLRAHVPALLGRERAEDLVDRLGEVPVAGMQQDDEVAALPGSPGGLAVVLRQLQQVVEVDVLDVQVEVTATFLLPETHEWTLEGFLVVGWNLVNDCLCAGEQASLLVLIHV